MSNRYPSKWKNRLNGLPGHRRRDKNSCWWQVVAQSLAFSGIKVFGGGSSLKIMNNRGPVTFAATNRLEIYSRCITVHVWRLRGDDLFQYCWPKYSPLDRYRGTIDGKLLLLAASYVLIGECWLQGHVCTVGTRDTIKRRLLHYYDYFIMYCTLLLCPKTTRCPNLHRSP